MDISTLERKFAFDNIYSPFQRPLTGWGTQFCSMKLINIIQKKE